MEGLDALVYVLPGGMLLDALWSLGGIVGGGGAAAISTEF